jgi:translocation and assembly module TamB
MRGTASMSVSARPSEAAATPRPPRRVWRWAAAVLALLLGLPALLVAAVLLAVNTAPGRDALADLAGRLVPGLAIEGLQGPLPGRPGFARLTMADAEGVWLEVQDARLAWDPLALLRGEARIEALTARRVALHRLPAGEAPAEEEPPGPVIPNLPELPVSVSLERLEAGRIELGAPVLGEELALHLAGQARLDPWGLTAALRAALAEGGGSLTLDASLRPGTGRLQARAALRGEPGGPLSRIAGLGERPIALDLSLDGPEEGAALNLAAAAGEGLGAQLSGTVSAPDTSRLGLAVEGRVDASGLAGPLAGPLDLRLDAGRMPDGLVELRTLRVAGAAGVLQGEGRLDTEGDRTALRLRAALPPSSSFAALLPGEAVGWEAVEAEAEVTGRLDAPRASVTLLPTGFRSEVAPLAALLGPAPRVTLRAAAPDRIELLTLAGQAIQAELRGRVGETLDIAFAADIAAPEAAVPGLSGALRLSGTATGALADPTLTLQAQSDRLEAAGRVLEALSLSARIATPATRPQVEARATGRIEELPLSLALRGSPEAEGWLRLEAAEAALGPARLTASGRLNPAAALADGEARLEAPDLAPFARLIGQPIAGAVRIEARGAPRDGVQTLAARVEVPRLSAAGVEARGVTATAEGSLAALDLALSGRVNDVEAEARGRVTEEAGARRLDLAALRATAGGETIRLAAPARVTLRPDGGVELGALTLALPRSGTLRAEGRWGPERADLRATLAGVNLAAFASLLPDVAPSGAVSGEARVTGPTGAPEVTATLRGSGLRSGVPAARGLPPGELRVELRRAGDGAVAGNAEARLGTSQRLAVTARFPRGPAADAPFEATVDGALDLGPLTAPLLAAGADRVTGRLALALRAGGTPTDPVLGGEARLSGGSYRNPVYGVAITDLAGTLRPDGRRLRADITGRTPGEGRLALTGTVEPFAPDLPVDLALTANNAQPVSSDLVRATLDAELRLAGLLGSGAQLAGRIGIRRAEIRVPERLATNVRTLGPVIERGAPPGRAAPRPQPRPAARAEAEGGLPITLAIVVEAPRNIFVRGRGLDAELGGALRITGRLADPQITGALELRRGDIAVAGRRLNFERGRLAWDGGLLPDLNFRATSQAGPVTARVDVTGPPTDPELTFSSTPELPQDEILARLLFDRPLSDLSPFELAQIAAAAAGAAGLPGGGATGVLDRLRQGLGLDRLAVGGGGEGASRNTNAQERSGPTVEAGSYVADGVYVGVRQGTESGSSRVGVRVDLTPRLKLEAETGDREAGNRVGLSWEWEWGR